MALKGDRQVVLQDISYFMNQTADRGGVACISTGGSGAAMDSAAQLCIYSTTASAVRPIGVLFNDVVDVDLTRFHLNQHKDEVQKGSKVTLLKIGQIVTDYIASSLTVAAGDVAYVGAEGRFTNVPPGGGATVGKFETKVDSEGFCKITVNIP